MVANANVVVVVLFLAPLLAAVDASEPPKKPWGAIAHGIKPAHKLARTHCIAKNNRPKDMSEWHHKKKRIVCEIERADKGRGNQGIYFTYSHCFRGLFGTDSPLATYEGQNGREGRRTQLLSHSVSGCDGPFTSATVFIDGTRALLIPDLSTTDEMPLMKGLRDKYSVWPVWAQGNRFNSFNGLVCEDVSMRAIRLALLLGCDGLSNIDTFVGKCRDEFQDDRLAALEGVTPPPVDRLAQFVDLIISSMAKMMGPASVVPETMLKIAKKVQELQLVLEPYVSTSGSKPAKAIVDGIKASRLRDLAFAQRILSTLNVRCLDKMVKVKLRTLKRY